MKQSDCKEESAINPSYDKNELPERRLYDFLGKYYINLNGVSPNDIPEITEPHKKEIVDFVLLLLQQAMEEVIGEPEENNLREYLNNGGVAVYGDTDIEARNQLRAEQRAKLKKLGEEK